ADATLLEFSDGTDSYTMLIDTGNWNATDVVSYLHDEKIKSIDIIAITHPHADHIGQLDKIIDAFNVHEVWMNGQSAESDVFLRALDAIEVNGVDYYEPEVGEVFDVGPLEITILHPSSLTGSTNNNSLSMRMTYGDVAFLFTGDAEVQAERDMLTSGANLNADILHVGHHGSNTSTTEDFLNAVNPEIAIYSAGNENQYEHPHEEVVTRLQAHQVLLYGTNTHGTVRVETDGATYSVQTN
ncbi:MBL fold metallo-hydrolase, partial [Microvirga sp. 3-52]|nr:MBL fold metallo-hydrolase [Microvirga sp. 3-52]